MGRSWDEATNACCSLWLLALARAERGRRLRCGVCLLRAGLVVLRTTWLAPCLPDRGAVAVALCFLWVEDEAVWGQHVPDTRTARTISIPIRNQPATPSFTNLCILPPVFMLRRNGGKCCAVLSKEIQGVPYSNDAALLPCFWPFSFHAFTIEKESWGLCILLCRNAPVRKGRSS